MCKESTMCSVESLREFVTERLTAAAEEIFGVFEKKIVEYEEEIDRQRRLLDVVWKPVVQLHRLELPQQHGCQEEVQTDQQPCKQERNSSLDQENPDLPQIKDDQEELCTSQDGEQLDLKQETQTFMLIPPHEESDQQLLPDSSPVNDSPITETRDKKNFKCDTCGKVFRLYSNFKKHTKIHTGEEMNVCKTCGKSFSDKSALKTHFRIHTGERPYSCNICFKRFKQSSQLNSHVRTHTSEKLYSCNTCGKRFTFSSYLRKHLIVHTGEKPYSCNTCGKKFTFSSNLRKHLFVHTEEKPYSCNTCGKCFSYKSKLRHHVRIHTGEKPYVCNTCGKCFNVNFSLRKHLIIHTGEKTHSCSICGERFRYASMLKKHVKTHTEYSVTPVGQDSV